VISVRSYFFPRPSAIPSDLFGFQSEQDRIGMRN
jgi:hypothetical protein